MIIYIVTCDWHYETHLCGAFTTKEKAQDWINVELTRPPKDGSYIRYHIKETNLV